LILYECLGRRPVPKRVDQLTLSGTVLVAELEPHVELRLVKKFLITGMAIELDVLRMHFLDMEHLVLLDLCPPIYGNRAINCKDLLTIK
jgi:hypothetical protein